MIPLLAPSPSSFIAVRIEIAIIMVPVQAVKLRCEMSRVDHKSCNSALPRNHFLAQPSFRSGVMFAQAPRVRRQVRIRVPCEVLELAIAFASSVIRCAPGNRQHSRDGTHKHVRETTIFCRNFSIFPMSRNTEICHIPARIVANSRRVCLYFPVSWQHMVAFSVFLLNAELTREQP